MVAESNLGKLAYSKAGRDKGRFFIIVGIINSEYVYISDGDMRKIEKPKKKKIKHIVIMDYETDKIKDMLLRNEKISNSEIKVFLQCHDVNKEV